MVRHDNDDIHTHIHTHTYIYHHHHHHHIVLAARISLTLSRHSSLSFIALGRSSGQQPVSSHSCWMYVRAGRPAFARPCVGIHKSTSLMSLSLLLLYIYIYIYIYIHLICIISMYCTYYIYNFTCIIYIYIYIYIYHRYYKHIIFKYIKLPWPENPANTHMRHTEHWTGVSTLLGLISSAYHNLHH